MRGPRRLRRQKPHDLEEAEQPDPLLRRCSGTNASMTSLTIPAWIWTGTAVAAIPVAAVVLAMLWEVRRPKPSLVVRQKGTRLELWETGRRLPQRSDLVLVPVAPDLQMVAGSSLWARGATAGQAQREAAKLAPVEPGKAAVVSGARYRFGRTGLIVAMDDRKRYAPEWILSAVRDSVERTRATSVASVLIPDWTDDLCRQPRRQDASYRVKVAADIAPVVVDAAVALLGEVPVVRIWVRDAALAPVYRSELERRLVSAQAVAA